MDVAPEPAVRAAPRAAEDRIVSIDALRGFDMFWIMGADRFFTSVLELSDAPWATSLKAQLEHTTWHGFTFYDLIFPLFLFLAGVSIPLAIERRRARGESRGRLVRHILIRTVTLFFFGLLVNRLLDLNFAKMRWPGVLQRIALCYCAASLAVCSCRGARRPCSPLRCWRATG